MEYVIIYEDGLCRGYAKSKSEVRDWLEILKNEEIKDIRRILRDGSEESVIDKFMDKEGGKNDV